MNNSNIILFDAYGTLFKIDTDHPILVKSLGQHQKDFLDLWRRKLIEYSWLTSLMNEWEDFNVIVDKAILYSCKYYKVDDYQIGPILKRIYENPTTFDTVKSVLADLKDKGFQCCILSNGVKETLKNAISRNQLDEYIDQIFSASSVQKYKVSPMVYRLATVHYNTGPSNMFFVSANSWDITGAQNFGYKTIWINRNEQVFDTLVESPDFEINTLDEISQIISIP